MTFCVGNFIHYIRKLLFSYNFPSHGFIQAPFSKRQTPSIYRLAVVHTLFIFATNIYNVTQVISPFIRFNFVSLLCLTPLHSVNCKSRLHFISYIIHYPLVLNNRAINSEQPKTSRHQPQSHPFRNFHFSHDKFCLIKIRHNNLNVRCKCRSESKHCCTFNVNLGQNQVRLFGRARLFVNLLNKAVQSHVSGTQNSWKPTLLPSSTPYLLVSSP